jgi:hypothetical protein
VTWPGINLPEHEQGVESELLRGVIEIDLQYLQDDRRWVDNWPLRFTEQDKSTVPRAVELTVLMENDLSIKRVFYVGPPA